MKLSVLFPTTAKILTAMFILYGGLMHSQEISLKTIPPLNAVTLISDDVTVRLDGRKFDNMNNIIYKNHQLTLDSAGAHFGQVVMFKDLQKKGHLGSGHIETGLTEQILEMKLIVNGEPRVLTEGASYSGKKIVFQKISMLRNLKAYYELTLENNQLYEKVKLTALKNEELKYLYCFMHPWAITFTDVLALNSRGESTCRHFVSDQKFIVYGQYPVFSWLNEKNGLGIVSVLTKSPHDYQRFVWDRPHYRKDYVQSFINQTFSTGITAQYEMQTAFLENLNKDNWEKNVRFFTNK